MNHWLNKKQEREINECYIGYINYANWHHSVTICDGRTYVPKPTPKPPMQIIAEGHCPQNPQ